MATEFEMCIFEKEIDVLQIGLNIFVDRGGAMDVKVVFHLHFIINENLAPAFRKHDFLFQRCRGAVADEIHGLFQIIEHGLDLVFIFRDFVFWKALGLAKNCKTKQYNEE